MRGLKFRDQVCIPGRLLPGCRSEYSLFSSSRGIEIKKVWSEVGEDYARPEGALVLSQANLTTHDTDDAAVSYCGFAVEEWRLNNLGRTRKIVIPYWSIVVPLTLLSTYLLLSKPKRLPERCGD